MGPEATSPPPELPVPPKRDQKELAKQLVTYADAITAFSFVQSTAFGFALGQCEFRESVLRVPYISSIVAGGAYLLYGYFVYKCHKGEKALLQGSQDAPVTKTWRTKIWWHRYGVVVLATALSWIALGLTIVGGHCEKKAPEKPDTQQKTTGPAKAERIRSAFARMSTRCSEGGTEVFQI